jgi:hypothetical protein
MAYLSFHRKSKQHNPVKQQNWPEHGDIEHWKERQNKGHTKGLCQSIPVKQQRNVESEYAKLLSISTLYHH